MSNYGLDFLTFEIPIPFEYFVVGVFEFLGTSLFAYINLVLISKSYENSDPLSRMYVTTVDFSFSMLLCIGYSRQMSGGVHNPANSLFRMLRKEERYPFKIGMIYITA